MGVKFLEHAYDGILYDLVSCYPVDIVALYVGKRQGQFPEVLVKCILSLHLYHSADSKNQEIQPFHRKYILNIVFETLWQELCNVMPEMM